ncbi:B12-binding domain-containing radical SAM protein [Thermodesulfobacteriota bacterium]
MPVSRNPSSAPIIATRGCPYPCTFCGAGKALGKKVRKRSIGNLLEEIDLLTGKYGVREIHIMDDNFTFDRDYTAGFCEALIKRKRGIFWALPNGVRLDSLDEDVLRLMEGSGCYSMAVGIESGNQHVLDHIRKRLSLEEIEEKIRLIKSVSDIMITGFFILGYPIETREDMKNTIDFALRIPIDRANFFNYTPFPGSEVYETLKRDGSIEGLDYDDLYIHNISFSPPGISCAEMVAFPRRAHLKFYLRPRVLWNLVREVKSLDQVKVIFKRAKTILIQKPV